MQKLLDFLERLIGGGVNLALLVGALILAVVVFSVSFVIGTIIFGY